MADRAVIEVTQGTPFSTISVTRVAATDLAVTRRWRGALEVQPPDRQRHLAPGTYAAMVALVAAEGPGVLAGLPPDEDVCMDYGTDSIRLIPAPNEVLDPALAPVSEISAVCPHPPLLGLIAALLETLDRGTASR